MDRNSFFSSSSPDSSKTEDENIRLIIPFNAQYKKVEKIIHKYWHQDKLIGNMLPVKPLITYTKAPNLGLKIAPTIKKKITKSNPNCLSLKVFFRCGRCKNCKTTKSPKRTNTVMSTRNDFTYQIREHLSCNSMDVIYLLQCPCQKQYVGRTKRLLKTRISEHMENITKGYELHTVSKHFKEHHNSELSLLTFTAFERIKRHWRGGNHIENMSSVESRRIFEFDTMIPMGLNAEMEIFGFL